MQVTRSQLRELGKFVKNHRPVFENPLTLEPTTLHNGTTVLLRDARGREVIVPAVGVPVPCPPGQWVTDPR